MILKDLPIEAIFNLLCVCRKIVSRSTQSIRRNMYKRGLYFGTFDMIADFGFWIRLCQSAMLLDEGSPPRPTVYVSDWFALGWQGQMRSLVEAWVNMPANIGIRRIRKQILKKLAAENILSRTDQRELFGLQALGVCDDEFITPLGTQLICDQGESDQSIPMSPWKIEFNELHIPYPPNWKHLWDLEAFLDPIDPGIYPLDQDALRTAAQHMKKPNESQFIQTLETGLQKPLPKSLLNCINTQPTIHLMDGIILEFSSPDELTALRKKASWRRDLEYIISPHHVHINRNQSERILNRLQRLGLITETDKYWVETPSTQTVSRLSTSEKAYLLSTVLISEGLGVNMVMPMGLLGKIANDLPMKLRSSAARKSRDILDDILPSPAWVPDEELPPVPETQLLSRLENVIQKKESIDILYKKTNGYIAEQRRVTPLQIEQRGMRFYIIAYCHNRRDNRTFRLDRLELI